jgi:hypothetical protein
MEIDDRAAVFHLGEKLYQEDRRKNVSARNMVNPSISLQPQRLRKLLQRMVDIYSPSGKEEEILEFLNRYLKRQGLPVLSQPVDENRYNLLVIPSEVEVQLALVGEPTNLKPCLSHYGYMEMQLYTSGKRTLGCVSSPSMPATTCPKRGL